jgi:predicted GNAT family acetyltransferase
MPRGDDGRARLTDSAGASAAAEPELRIVDNPDERRYEARLGDQVVGFSEYKPVTGRRIFLHTEVDPAFEGRGYGSRLAAGALEDVRAQGLKATIHCPFISAYVKRHHEFDDIILRR